MNRGTALSEEIGQQAIHAIRRLHEIEKQTLLTPNTEAEKAGIKKFISDTCAAHADELLACWSAVRFEYEPFVGSLSLVFDRVSSIRRNRQLANQLPAQPPETESAELTKNNEGAVAAVDAEPSNIIHVTC